MNFARWSNVGESCKVTFVSLLKVWKSWKVTFESCLFRDLNFSSLVEWYLTFASAQSIEFHNSFEARNQHPHVYCTAQRKSRRYETTVTLKLESSDSPVLPPLWTLNTTIHDTIVLGTASYLSGIQFQRVTLLWHAYLLTLKNTGHARGCMTSRGWLQLATLQGQQHLCETVAAGAIDSASFRSSPYSQLKPFRWAETNIRRGTSIWCSCLRSF